MILRQVQVELDPCIYIVEPEVPMTIYNIASEVWMNLSHAYTFTMVINNNCL